MALAKILPLPWILFIPVCYVDQVGLGIVLQFDTPTKDDTVLAYTGVEIISQIRIPPHSNGWKQK